MLPWEREPIPYKFNCKRCGALYTTIFLGGSYGDYCDACKAIVEARDKEKKEWEEHYYKEERWVECNWCDGVGRVTGSIGTSGVCAGCNGKGGYYRDFDKRTGKEWTY